ncbi:PA14 domain-containing protein [Spirosoma jeollabukense]
MKILLVVWGSSLLLISGGSMGWAQRQSPTKSLVGGLTAEYFNGPNFEHKILTRIDPQVDFDWNWQYPAPGVQREYFSVRWSGKLYAPISGTYRFKATVDDGVRVWVGNKLVINEWRKQDDSQFVGEITLKAHQYYTLRIEYYNDWKGSVISVFWEPPQRSRGLSLASTGTQVIPAQYLFTRPILPDPPMAAKLGKLNPLKPTVSYRSGLTATPNRVPTKPVGLSSPPKPAPVKELTSPGAEAATTPDQSFDHLSVGEAVVLQGVFFVQSQYELLPASYLALDRLVKALRLHPAWEIEVSGHTDNVGDKRLNQALSEQRAKVVASYLTRHGIAEERLTIRGYGGSRPLVANTTEDQRAQNRRVELVIK